MVEPLRFSEMTESDRDAFIRDARSPFDYSLEFSDGEDVANEVIGTASPPDCDKWSQSIEVLLDDPAGLEVFRTFLTDQKREQGLSFWMATKMFRDNAFLQNGGAKENLQLQARSIFTQYLAKSAPQRVLIRDSTTRKIGAALQVKAVAGDLFVDAQAETVARMTERDYPEFLRSAIFREYVEKASRRRQRQHDAHSDVLLTLSVQGNGEPVSPPYSYTQSLWGPPEPSPLWDTKIMSTVATRDEDDATSVSDMATNNEESASRRSQRRQRMREQRSKREVAAFKLDNLPKEEYAEEVPRPRKPQPAIKPAEFSCLLEDRLNEVIRNRELPRVLGNRRLLDDIAEQPEQSDCTPMNAQSVLEQLSVPPVSSRMSDVSSESGVSQASAEWYAQHRKERAAITRKMPIDSGHHSDLVSSVEDLVRATKLCDTPAQERHRRLSQQRHEHQHHHKHSHHHHYVPKDRHHLHPLMHDASSTSTFPRSRGRRDFSSSQSVMSDPWAMASPDQRSVYSSTSADETLSFTFERQFAASSSSSVVSYRSNPERQSERQPVVFSCATRYDSSQMRAHSQHRYRSSSAKSIEVVYKLNGDKYKQYLPGPQVTLADFKTLVGGKYKYFFEVQDPSDPEAYFEEFTTDSDLLPIYDGRIVGRVRAQKAD